MALNSKQKGKVGEREVAEIFRSHGIDARRAVQFCGSTGEAADIIADVPFHIEIKRVERLNLGDAYRQAQRDSQGKKPPVVVHRASRQPWLITMSLVDFLNILSPSKGEAS